LAVGSLSGLAANSYVIDVASGSQLTQPGMVLQVVNATKTDTFSTTSGTVVDVTGMSATITPSSASNKVLVMLSFRYGASASGANFARLDRSGTTISLGLGSNPLSNVYDAHGNKTTGFGDYSVTILDTPASTSSLTYKLQVSTTAGTLHINNRNDGDAGSRLTSSITLMEVAG